MSEEMKIRRYTPHTEEECRNVAKRIINLQQENQQLKEELKDENNYHNEAVKWYKEAFEIEQERIKYRNVLDEMREYIKEKAKEDEECADIRFINFGEGVDYDLLKILDKVER